MVDPMGLISYSPIGTLTFGGAASPVTLYPIPAKDILHISAPGISEPRNVELYSVTGQLLESREISTLDGSTLAVSTLPPGSYYVRIWGGGQSLVLSFLKH
jgi:hypothetical protein